MNIPSWVGELFDRGGYLDDEGHIKLRPLILHTLFLMVLVFALYWGAFRLYRSLGWNSFASVGDLIEDLGVGGPALYVFIVDLLIIPLSVDLIWPFVASWSLIKAALVLSSASMAAAVCSHLIGRLIGLIPLFRRWVVALSQGQTRKLINRYGAWAIVISALTPMPFSTITMASGVLRLSFWRVLAASSVRILRMGLYYLIFTALIL